MPEVGGGQTKSFTIKLSTGEFADIAVEQGGAILSVRLLDPARTEIMVMDYPGGGYGPIYLSTIAATPGNYYLEVRSVNKWALPKKCKVTLSKRAERAEDRASVNAQLAFSRGRQNFNSDKFQDALTAFKESLDYWKSKENYHWQAVTQFAMSEAYGNRDRMNRTRCLAEVVRLFDVGMPQNDWRIKASALNDLGAILSQTQEIERAQSSLEQALDIYKQHEDRRGQASALSNIGGIYYNRGDLSKAEELIAQAVTLRNEENDKPGVANLINNLGAMSDRAGDPAKAVEHFNQALQTWQEVGELDPAQRGRVATLLGNLAAAKDKLGRWEESFEFYDKAIASYDEGNAGRAVPLDNKGELHAALGDSVKARKCYEEALRLLNASGRPNINIKASVLVHMGQLFLAENEVATALKYFEEARALKPPDPRLSDVLTNIGAALAMNNEPEKALDAYQSALNIQNKLKEPRGQALALQRRGETLAHLRRHKEAGEDFSEALKFWRMVKDRRGEATTLNNIARLERDRGDLAEAVKRSDEAIQTIESLRTSISSRQLRTSYFAIQEDYYELNVDLKMKLWKAENREQYLVAALETAEKARARVLLEALNEAGLSRGEFNKSSDPAIANLLMQRTTLLAKLSAKAQARTSFLSIAQSPEQIARFDQEISELTENYDAVETQLRSKNPRFATLTKTQPATVSEIQAQLDPQTILIEYLLGEDRSYVWVVTNNSINGFELLPKAQIEELAQRVYEALSIRGRQEPNENWKQSQERIAKAESDFTDASAALSEMVLGPIASLLGDKRLVIVADGTLQMLPFAALPAPKGLGAPKPTPTASMSPGMQVQVPLLERHEIVNSPSASVLVLQRRELAGRTPAPYAMAVIADPVFDELDARVVVKGRRPASRNTVSRPNATAKETESQTRALSDIGDGNRAVIRRLGFSLAEAREIFKLVAPNQTLKALDFDASRTTFLSPQLSRYRIIHLATHGIMNVSHPEMSGIILSMVDEKGRPEIGYVGLNDIYNLNLPADLIVLSACETGVGKQIRGEGLIALTRGFMHAGGERVVASLWRVNDQATAELMAKFYKEMIVNKRSAAAALRAAQLELYRRNVKPHLWAGFVLQGEWR